MSPVKPTETKSVLLLNHHPKALRLPTIHNACKKTAARWSKENVDHLGFLLRLCELDCWKGRNAAQCVG